MTRVRTDVDVRIPMPDGVELSADVWRPDTHAPVHLVLSRTPYNDVLEVVDEAGHRAPLLGLVEEAGEEVGVDQPAAAPMPRSRSS